jgi:hypothetical protein
VADAPIAIVHRDDFHWLVINGRTGVGYVSLTHAEAYKAGFEARRRGAHASEVDQYEAPQDRCGVHRHRMREAWLDGWRRAAHLRAALPREETK